MPGTPPNWSVPRDWPGGRVFIVAGGSSIIAQPIEKLPRPLIMVKHAALRRMDADVLYYAGVDSAKDCESVIRDFRGARTVARAAYKDNPAPPHVHVLGKVAGDRKSGAMRLSHDPTRLAGWDSGSSAINLAFLFGATEIVVLGLDMVGRHFFPGHRTPITAESIFQIHLAGLRTLAADLVAAGVKVWNASPASRVDCFEKRNLKEFL